MLNLVKIPQRFDIEVKYEITNDRLKVIFNDNIVETFDFTGFPEGIAEEIIAEALPVNPIISAEKIGNTVNVKVSRFYGVEEKALFEAVQDGDD